VAADPTSIVEFSKVTPYLTNPLSLIGFVLLLLFGIYETLIKSGILPPVSRTASSKIVRLLLNHGFIVAVLVILAGFGLEAWNSYLKAKPQHSVIQQAGDCSANANGNGNTQSVDCGDKDKK